VVSARHTLAQTFAALRASGRIGLLPFVPAGYPDLDTTAALLSAMKTAGASAVEVGFPFSDPIADGPAIQEAFACALQRRIRVDDIFRMIGAVRQGLTIPLVAMVSYSVVFRYGTDRFLETAGAAGFDGLIVPDLPPPQAQNVCDRVRARGLDTILLVAPTTPAPRRAEIAQMCSGFLYYLAVSGTTGERAQLPDDLVQNVRQIRTAHETPVCVGFGISRKEHVESLIGVADGAIVGSAVVRQIKERISDSPAVVADHVAGFCRQLLS
jgi:tryptophan synthase alpha chain